MEWAGAAEVGFELVSPFVLEMKEAPCMEGVYACL